MKPPSSHRSIVHLDADAFFASVEQAADARLRGKPVAVGGEKRGIIASASYEARKFGIYTPMPSIMARRLCPKLILLPGDFEKYELFSRLMFSYAYDFTPDVEIGSIDEGYFDLTGARQPAVGIAQTVRHAIRQALKLSVSEGVASNKLVSQIASKLNKPFAFENVPPGHEAGYLSPLPNKWLPGIGPKMATQFNSAGLARIGQIACTPAETLGLIAGSQARQLRNFALGIDERPIVPVRAPAKSYGEQETFAADTTDEPFLDATLRRMADQLMAKVRDDGKSIRTLTVKVRYNDMDEEQASESLAEPTDLETEIYSRISALLRRAWRRRVSLRLVSLKLSNVYDTLLPGVLLLDISDCRRDSQQRLASVVDVLRQKYGRSVLLRGHDFVLRCDREAADAGSTRPRNHLSQTRAPSPRLIQQGGASCQTTLKAPSSSYQHTVIQRQRIGNSFARVLPPAETSSIELKQDASGVAAPERSKSGPAPELRFRNTAITPSKFKIQNSKFDFLPLNVHSYYSFLDSTLSIKAIIELAQHYQLPAIALTDKNNLHGAVEFTQAALAAGIKPIIGAELNCRGHRLCLYAQNQTGYSNLCRILSQKSGAGKPESGTRSREPELWTLDSGLCEGLLAVSSDVSLASFFPGRFYLEISSLEALEKLHRHSIPHSTFCTPHSAFPLVASFPIHYALPSDRWKYDVVQSIRTLTLLRQPHPEKRLQGEYHFPPPAEMRRLFAAHPELLANTFEIADRCDFTPPIGKPQFPPYPPPNGLTSAAFLRRLVMEGLQRRYPQNHAQLKPQLEQELEIITEVGYEEYFLIMWDILQECRRRGIDWITRGSAADSLACYCLEISSVCPIRFDLYFRRFLNKERMALNKLPDIDVDFPHDRKDHVIDLIFEKYGPEHAAVVGGFSTFQSRSAFAEVAKVLGVSEFQVRRITERLPHFSRASELAQATAETLECRDLPLDQKPYSTALQMARFLDGFPRYPKMHPCGLVLSRQPMHELTPSFISAKGYPTTHFDMDSVEAIGLVKMDILAQGGLAVMRDVQQMLSNSEVQSSKFKVQSQNSESGDPKKGRNPDSEVKSSMLDAESAKSRPLGIRCSTFDPPGSDPGHQSSFGPRTSALGLPSPLGPFDDPDVWSLIASGQARAVHHIESPAMISLCKMCNVRDIDTLIAIVSVIRPGAANESKKMEFARRYQGLSHAHYPHPSLQPCLRSTYGLVVYEEHILQICEAFAGLPPGRADILRRALAKERTDIVAQIQTEFANCARRLGRAENEITEVWDLVTGFRGYAFCKAHSTAYGVEAYQSAWLKLHYPAEFMAAVLTNGKGFYSPLVYVLECHRLGIPLLPPSVNEPGPHFKVENSGQSAKSEIRNPNRSSFSPQPLAFSLSIVNDPGPHFKVENSSQSAKSEIRNPNRSSFSPQPLAFSLSIVNEPGPHFKVENSGQSAKSEIRNPNRSSFSLQPLAFSLSIRVPLLLVKGLTQRTKDAILRERARSAFTSLADFFHRVQPLPEEMESLIRVGAFDPFGQSRTTQYWQFKGNAECRMPNTEFPTHPPHQLPLFSPLATRLPPTLLTEPTRLDCLRAEEEFLGYPASGHPLELFPDIAWDTYCPVNRLAGHLGEQIVTCGLVIEQRLFHQVTGEPMKFITIADWTGVIETELFAKTYKSYGLNTIRYRVLEITATVEPFENNRGFTLRVLRAAKPRTKNSELATQHAEFSS